MGEKEDEETRICMQGKMKERKQNEKERILFLS